MSSTENFAANPLQETHQALASAFEVLREATGLLSQLSEIRDAANTARPKIRSRLTAKIAAKLERCFRPLRRFQRRSRQSLDRALPHFAAAAATMPLPTYLLKIGSEESLQTGSTYHELAALVLGHLMLQAQLLGGNKIMRPGSKSSQPFRGLEQRDWLWPALSDVADLGPALISRMRQEYFSAVLLRTQHESESTSDLFTDAVHSETLPTANPRRPAERRNLQFWEWKGQGLTPARIRDRWNALSDDQRREICPGKPDRIGTKDAGIDNVKKGLKSVSNSVNGKIASP